MVVAVANQKGGVGKTTVVVNLGSCLSVIGKKVLIIDIDAQANSTSGLGLDKSTVQPNIYNVLIKETDITEAIKPTQLQNLFILPSTPNLVAAEIELVFKENREFILKKKIEPIKNNYDYVLIDTPPSLGLLTLNSLTAADVVIIPVQCEYYALEGLSQLLGAISLIQGRLNANLKIAGILLTMFDSRTNLSHQVAEEVRKCFPTKVYNTVIPVNVKLAEAPSFGKPIILYDISSTGAKAYIEFTKEFIKRL